jgi:hypothetical protein
MDEQILPIPLTKIDEDPAFQVRRQWTPSADATLRALAASLQGPEGLIHPLVVGRLAQPTTVGRTFALIAGHRRLAAARQLGWTTILARVLPPCDLTAPHHRLRLFAMAVRENTEREPLLPEDRRAALTRLKALYDAVSPPIRSGRTPGAVSPSPETADTRSFSRWAAKHTQIPLRTMQRDVRCMLLTRGLVPPQSSLPPTAMATTTPDIAPPERLSALVQQTLQAVAQATTALQKLATSVPLATQMVIPDAQFTDLRQTLGTLQTVLHGIWPALRVQTEHPLVPFALVAQEQLAALRGTLWGLRTGTPEVWATLPLPVARALRTAMTALLADWQVVASAMQTRLSSVPAEEAPPLSMSPPWGASVAQA